MIAIGIDTGGTCTDAVVYDMNSREILASGKALTTKSNLEIGIANVLDLLPEELLKKADIFSLSTTLATNTCVENKGCRAKLLIIGTTDEMVRKLNESLRKYGITETSQLIVLDARVENLYSDPYDPDWDELARRVPELFSDCDAVGIVQTFPSYNGGRFEVTAMRLLKEHLTIPVTIAFDITSEVDFLRICASTLLNARLIPLIADFMKAMRNVMDARGLKIPISIVRSDGTLMSEEMARTHPVETLICGPAASVIGGYELTHEENALIVDMGGTTTALALLQNGEPVRVSHGVHIGQYRTAIKGLDARAISLGGDTGIRFKDDELILDSARIIPISILASEYENILPDLKKLYESGKKDTRGWHEFFVLQRDISGKKGYTEYEQKVCEILKEGPLIMQDFLNRADSSIYHLGTDRLEQEGVVIRSGLTPTDIMVLRGDLDLYDKAAAQELVRFIERALETDGTLPDTAYEMVIRRMYKSIAFFLLKHRYPGSGFIPTPESADPLLDAFYEQAREDVQNESAGTCAGDKALKGQAKTNPSPKTCAAGRDARSMLAHPKFTTDVPLIAIGAPTHVFLPDVAKLLGTRAVIPPYAHVANPLGAAACNKAVWYDFRIKAEYDGACLAGFSMIDSFEKVVYEEKEDAIAAGLKIAERLIRERAAHQGLGKDPVVELTVEETTVTEKIRIITGIVIHAAARERM